VSEPHFVANIAPLPVSEQAFVQQEATPAVTLHAPLVQVVAEYW
jgi:hypothetical protein